MSSKQKLGPYVCTQCNFTGMAKYRGKITMSLLLLCLGFFPGVIYILWSLNSGRILCPSCGSLRTMVPAESPQGSKIIQELAGEPHNIKTVQELENTNRVATAVIIFILLVAPVLAKWLFGS